MDSVVLTRNYLGPHTELYQGEHRATARIKYGSSVTSLRRMRIENEEWLTVFQHFFS